MKNIAILSIAGLAAAASAQSVTLHFDVDGDALTGSEVAASDATWTVYASFTGYDDASAYFGGFVGEFLATGDGTASNFTNLMGGEGTPATANGASVSSINIFSSALLGNDDPSNPLAIFTFDTAGSTTLTYTADGVASVFPDDGIFALPDEYEGVAINIISDTLVPAPGAAALLGLGGLAATRRRR